MNSNSETAPRMGATELWLLLALAFVWGGAFVFAEIALTAFPPLTVVLLRVGLGAVTLVLVVMATRQALPRGALLWQQLFVMAALNNVIPFSLIVWGQTQITAGLASILNGLTPIFALLVAWLFTSSGKLRISQVIGVVLGFVGVIVLIGPAAFSGQATFAGQLAVLGAACSYGFAATYGRRFAGIAPIKIATGQLICSTVMMVPIACVVDQPWTLSMPGGDVVLAVVLLAVVSTALAYIMFFRILSGAGAINVSLVTLLIPVFAIGLGSALLGEPLVARQIAGATVIGLALLVIDGRLFGVRQG